MNRKRKVSHRIGRFEERERGRKKSGIEVRGEKAFGECLECISSSENRQKREGVGKEG